MRNAFNTRVKTTLEKRKYIWRLTKWHFKMHVYWCSIVSGELTLLEHEAAKWVEVDDTLPSVVDWLPADQLILDKIEEIL